MPAAILVVAGGLAIWGARQSADRQVEIEQLVRGLVNDVAAGRDPAPHLAATDPLIARNIVPALEKLLAKVPAGEIEVLVTEGDRDTEVNLLQPATHLATLRNDGEALLGLRLIHHGRSDRIAIIGLWRPPALDAP